MSNWFSGDIVSSGIRIRYHRTGGDKPTLLIAHGVTDNGLSWSRFARAMEQNYDVILYDRRGHGFSDAPESGYTFRDHAEDMAGLITALGLDRPHILGHSGGAVTGVAANVARIKIVVNGQTSQKVRSPGGGLEYGEVDLETHVALRNNPRY